MSKGFYVNYYRLLVALERNLFDITLYEYFQFYGKHQIAFYVR
jgi:hypothetical protein